MPVKFAPIVVGFGAMATVMTAVGEKSYAQSGKSLGDRFDCLIEPHTVVNLGSPVEGVLATVAVKRGDLVAKGQVIAKLESGVEEAIVTSARARANSDVLVRAARARHSYRARQLKRNEKLKKRGVISFSKIDESRTENNVAELELQEAQFNLGLAKLELQRAQRVLEQRTIRSPIDGVVMDRNLSAGEYVHKQASVVKIARIDLLNVEAFVPIAHYGRIRTGMLADVRPQEPIGGHYAAKVSVVDKVLNAASGTFRVRLELNSPNFRVPGGVRCSLKFDVD